MIAKLLYPTWEEGYGPSDYQPILNHFGDIIIQIDDNNHQGDSRILYFINKSYYYLQFGWGSCRGCDALRACATWTDIEDLIYYLKDQIKYLGSIIDVAVYFNEKNWDQEYSWNTSEQKVFINKVKQYCRKKMTGGKDNGKN